MSSPFPGRVAAPLLGRLEAQLALRARLKQAREGRRAVVVVSGEAGSGKSRLLAEEAGYAELMGAHLLVGRCDEQRTGRPLAALRDALGPSLAADRDPETADVVAEVARRLDHRLSGPARHEPTPPARRPAVALSLALGRLLARWSQDAVLLLQVDDLQAADADTCDTLGHLVRHLRGRPVVVVAAVRAPVPDHVAALLRQWERELGPDLTRLDLGPLDEHDSRALLRALAGVPLDDATLHRLGTATRGVPLLVEEAVAAWRASQPLDDLLADTTAATDRAAGLTLTDDGARTLLLRRLLRAHPHAVAVGEVLALLQRPRPRDLPLVAHVAGLTEDEAAGAVTRLLADGTLTVAREPGAGPAVEDDAFRFSLPVARRALLDAAGPERCWRLQDALAQSLLAQRRAGRPVDTLELATHLAATATAGDQEAVAVVLEVATSLADQAPRAAAQWYARALALLAPDDDRRGGVQAQRARALFLGGRLLEAVADGQQVLARGLPPARLARTGGIVVAALLSLGEVQDAVATAERVLAQVPTGAERVRTQLAAGLNNLDRLDEGLAHLATVLDADPDPTTAALAHGVRASIALSAGRTTEMLQALDAAYAVPGLPLGGRLSALTNDAVHSALACEIPRARSAHTEARTLGDTLGAVAFDADLDLAALLVAWRSGEWDQLEDDLVREIAELAGRGQRLNLTMLAALLVDLRTARGDLGAAAQAERTVLDGPSVGRSLGSWARAGLLAARGERATALTVVRRAWEEDAAAGRHSTSTLLLTRAVDLAVSLGEDGLARSAADDLAGLVADRGTTRAESFVLRAQGVARGDAALLRESAAVALEHGMPLEAAHARHAAGRLTGDVEADLLPALRCYEDLRADGWRRQVVATLRALGVTVPRAGRSGPRGTRPAGLSEAELRLAGLVQDGLSNRQIATALSLSPKTIEVYLSRLFDKVGVRSRVELAVAMTEGRLTPSERPAPAGGGAP